MRRCSIFLRIGETVNRKKKIESHCAKRHPWGAFSFLEMPVKSKKGWRTEKGFSSQVPWRTTIPGHNHYVQYNREVKKVKRFAN